MLSFCSRRSKNRIQEESLFSRRLSSFKLSELRQIGLKILAMITNDSKSYIVTHHHHTLHRVGREQIGIRPECEPDIWNLNKPVFLSDTHTFKWEEQSRDFFFGFFGGVWCSKDAADFFPRLILDTGGCERLSSKGGKNEGRSEGTVWIRNLSRETVRFCENANECGSESCFHRENRRTTTRWARGGQRAIVRAMYVRRGKAGRDR